MRFSKHLVFSTAAAAYAIASTFGSVAPSFADDSYDASQQPYYGNAGDREAAADAFSMRLTPSSTQLAQCMPNAQLDVSVKLTTDKIGSDNFEMRGHGLAPNRDYAVFLLEQAGAPFGAAEYIGDLHADADGTAYNAFNAIVQEAFVSTVVDGKRVRVDLNRVGMWFADPLGDDFCLGDNAGPVTPFDGDGQAGIQAFNSANADPLPNA